VVKEAGAAERPLISVLQKEITGITQGPATRQDRIYSTCPTRRTATAWAVPGRYAQRHAVFVGEHLCLSRPFCACICHALHHAVGRRSGRRAPVLAAASPFLGTTQGSPCFKSTCRDRDGMAQIALPCVHHPSRTPACTELPSTAIVGGRIYHGVTPCSKTKASNVRPSLPVDPAQVPETAGRLTSPPWPPFSNPRARLAKRTRRDVNKATCNHHASPLGDDVGSPIARALPALPALPYPTPGSRRHQQRVLRLRW
jgi:hypothetical protein